MGVQHFPQSMDKQPIPADVKPGRGWCRFMVDLARLIGAHDVLRVCEALGGQDIYIPADHQRSPLLLIVGAAKSAAVSRQYSGDTVSIPVARFAIARARRAGVIASVRAGGLTVADAARKMGMRREYVSKLVNQTDEGDDAVPTFEKVRKVDPRQIDMFPDR